MPLNRIDDPARERTTDTLQQRVMALLGLLPARQVRELLRQVSGLRQVSSSRLDVVRHAVIEYLNRRRPQRSRRLFTELFQPILTADAVLLRARRLIPGMVQRADVAGLWTALGGTAFARTADAVQKRLDELAATTVLDDVFQNPEVEPLRQQLREHAIRVLEHLLAEGHQPKDFLESLNRRRLTEARPQTLYLETIAPADLSFLRFVTEYLAVAEACRPILGDSLAGPEGESGSEAEAEAERTAAHLNQAATRLRESVLTPQTRSELRQLAPLVALNVGHRYQGVALYIRENGYQGDADDAFIIEALVAHFAACCAVLPAILGNALKLETRLPTASIRLTVREIAEVEAALHRLARLLPALIVAGLLENRLTEPVFRFIWQDLARFLSDRLVPVAVQRATVVMTQRAGASVDHKDVVWLLRLIWNWHQLARSHDQSFPIFDRWRDHMLADLEVAVEKAVRFEDGEAVEERLNHLLRLNEIAIIFNRRLSRYLSVSSQNVARMVACSLGRQQEMSVEERALAIDFLGLVRTEVGRSRNWRSPELAELLRLAEARGL